jgi:regulatory protein
MEREAEAIHRAKVQAYRLLAYRSQTTCEVRARLARKGYTGVVIDEVLRQLVAEGYIDDRKVAFDWARYRLQAKPVGRRRLAWELHRRGIPQELIEEAMREIYAELDETALAYEVARRRLGLGPGPRTAQEHRRLARYLSARGFEADSIAAVLERLSSPPLRLEFTSDDDFG